MSYWTFDDVYEELGVPKTFMNNAFGLIGTRGVPRRSFNTFALLHRLGEEQLTIDAGPVLATRLRDGSLSILVWNLIPRAKGQHTSMGDPTSQMQDRYATEGKAITVSLQVHGKRINKRAQVTHVDEDHGSAMPAYRRMGSPPYPTVEQIAHLKQAAALPSPEALHVEHEGILRVTLPPNGVALVEIG